MNIYASIVAIMNEIGAIGKDQKNPQQGYKYRGIDQVMNALHGLLCKYKVFLIPEVLETTREERVNSKGTTLIYTVLKMKYTFMADDGSSVSTTVIGEGMDSGDKSANKAMSTCFKYACFQVLCIPTEEMVDSETESHEVLPKNAPQQVVEDAKAKAQKIGEMKAEILRQCNEKNINLLAVEAKYGKPLDEMDEKQLDNAIKCLNISKKVEKKEADGNQSNTENNQ